jgi:hypothetical protein
VGQAGGPALGGRTGQPPPPPVSSSPLAAYAHRTRRTDLPEPFPRRRRPAGALTQYSSSPIGGMLQRFARACGKPHETYTNEDVRPRCALVLVLVLIWQPTPMERAWRRLT